MNYRKMSTVEKLRARPGAKSKPQKKCPPLTEELQKILDAVHQRSLQICRDDNRLRLTTPHVHEAVWQVTGHRMLNSSRDATDEERSSRASAQRTRVAIARRLRAIAKRSVVRSRPMARGRPPANIPLNSGFPEQAYDTGADCSSMSDATSNNTVEMKSLGSGSTSSPSRSSTTQDEKRFLASNSSGMSIDLTPKTECTESMSVSPCVGDDLNKGHASDEDRRADETLYDVEEPDFDTEPDSISSSRKLSVDGIVNLPDLPVDRRDSMSNLTPVPTMKSVDAEEESATKPRRKGNAGGEASAGGCHVNVVAERLAETAIDPSKKLPPKKSTRKSGTETSPSRKSLRTNAEQTSPTKICPLKAEEENSPKCRLERSESFDNETKPTQLPPPPRRRLIAKRSSTMECETRSPPTIAVNVPVQSRPSPRTPEPRATKPRAPNSQDQKPGTPGSQPPGPQADAGDIPTLRRSSPRVGGRRPVLAAATSAPNKKPEDAESTKPEQLTPRPKSN